jgi:DNA-binding SARP family transcriptional activator
MTRQRLLDSMFENLDKKLVLIIAPAGYGKTSLLIDFTELLEFPVCWYSISSHDQDPLRFFAHFISSIQQKFPAFGQSSLTAMHNASQGTLDLHYLVSTVINDAYENISEHFIITLEDFHLVDDVDPISEFISDFIQGVDDNCTVIITSRKLLTLPDMTLFVARNMVGGISYEELAFTPEEIQQLYLQNHQQSLTDETATNFYEQTEGWVTGLLLSSQINEYLCTSQSVMKRIAGIGVEDYFDALLAQQPARIQDFLLRTSLLEEFNEGYCRQVIETALSLSEINWRKMMDYIIQRNIFVMPVGSDGNWLRYHRIFLDFLQKKIRETRPDEVDKIQLHLAKVYTDQQEWELAYALYQQINNEQAILNLIEIAGPHLIASGRLELLGNWISALSDLVRQQHPALLSLYGTVLNMKGDPQDGIVLLNQAIDSMEYPQDKQYITRSLVRRAAAHRLAGNLEDARNDADQVLSLIEKDDDLIDFKAEALRSKGVSLFQEGAYNDAVPVLYDSLKAFQVAGDQHSQSILAMEIGVVEEARGEYKKAEEMYTQARGYWEKTANSVWLANLMNNLGVLQQLIGEYEAAGASFEKAYHHARTSGFARMQAFTLTGVGDIYREVDAINEATTAYRQARPIAEIINERFLLTYLDLEEAVIASFTDDEKAAADFLHSAIGRAETSGSNLEKHIAKLEWQGFLLWTDQAENTLENLKEEAEFFASEGHQHQMEKSDLYLAIAFAKSGWPEKAEEYFIKVLAYASRFSKRSPLIASGWGIKNSLLELGKARDVSPQVLELLRRVEEFDKQIPNIRKKLRKYASAVPFAPPKLYIQSLGKMQVRLNDRVLTNKDWKTNTSRDLFFLLLAHPEGLNKEQIGLYFWPDASPSEIKFRIKNTVYRMRHAVSKEAVVLQEEYYTFNHTLDYQYDLENFQKEIALARKTDDSERAISHLIKAVEHYHGPFLPDLEDNWIISAREHLNQNYLEILMKLSRHFLAEKDFNQAIHYSQLVIAADPCFESAYRMMMRIHAAQGNRAGVVRQYEKCKDILMKEIEVDPSPQTHELYLTLTR